MIIKIEKERKEELYFIDKINWFQKFPQIYIWEEE